MPQPTQANAGSDQLNILGTSTSLAGNTPISGTGLWEIVSGTGGTVVNPTNPISEFQGLAGNEYTLSWTITTTCGSSEDQVIISFADFGQPCPGIPTVTYEGQTYNTVLIGDQCWFKENLNVGTKINSTAGGYQQTNNGIIEKYCYNNDLALCDIYGGLYEWPEAMQYVTTEGAQGICPAGWHIPTDGEWTILTNFLGGLAIAGGKMKSTGTIDDGTGLWYTPNTGATNSSGFTCHPGSLRSGSNGAFTSLGYAGKFWSSSKYLTSFAYGRNLSHNTTIVTQYVSNLEWGFSIRCLKD